MSSGRALAAARVAADWLARPVAIVAIPVMSLVALLMFGANVTTFALSVLALTVSQLLLLAGAADTKHIEQMLQAMVVAHPDIPDDLAEPPK